MKGRALGIGLNMLGIILMVVNSIVFAEVNFWLLLIQLACVIAGTSILLVPSIRDRWK